MKKGARRREQGPPWPSLSTLNPRKLQTRLSLATPPPPSHGGWPSPARPSRMKFQPRPGFEALEVRGGRIFRSKHCLLCFLGLDPPKAPGGPWSPGGPCRPLEPPEAAWNCVETLTMMGLAFWVRWIMTRALLRDTRSFSYRFVARSQNTFRLLVKCSWTPEGFQAPNAIH